MKVVGSVGFSEPETDEGAGVYSPVITERRFKGERLTDSSTRRYSDEIMPGIYSTSYYSILIDAFMENHYPKIVYLRLGDDYWAVTSVEFDRPRLRIRIGDRYNGATA